MNEFPSHLFDPDDPRAEYLRHLNCKCTLIPKPCQDQPTELDKLMRSIYQELFPASPGSILPE